MHFFSRKPWDLPQSQITEESVYRRRRQHRRDFLQAAGLGAAGIFLGLPGCSRPTDEELEQAGCVDPPPEVAARYPAARNETFQYGREETRRREAAEYTNFYEFTGPSPRKDSYNYVADFRTSPWTLEVGGLCERSRAFTIDDLYREFTMEERAYRHRCVETWAMCIPWTGFPLRELLQSVGPKPGAMFVAFETAAIPEEMPYLAKGGGFPWPYTEGLRIAEALNELTLVVLGVYGEPLPKQHGAPVRVVVPWKYGFKGGKSLIRITLTDRQPATFWNTISAREYDFEANVNPEIPHPRWSQETEWMLGSGDRFDTVLYNGYGDFVGDLYG